MNTEIIEQYLHTKNDIKNLSTKHPYIVCEYLKNEYKKSLSWQETGILDKKTSGIEDETHKIEKKDGNYIQLELKMNPKAPFCTKFGYSEKEIKEIIKNIETGIV